MGRKKERMVASGNAFLADAMDTFRRLQFGLMDIMRRTQGEALAALGAAPDEHPYQIAASGGYWRLRDYGGHGASLLLIVAAPIKRPYVWDLSPAASAISCCLRYDLHVNLLEWLPASSDTGNFGFDECASAISECVARVAAVFSGDKPFVIGHSLGGTLATIYGALAPESIRGLVLLGSPLCFQQGESRFRDALVSLVPAELSDTAPIPGSLLSQISALAAPDTFIWSRAMDAASSVTDPRSRDICALVERWALDEVPLPGRLVHQIIQWLYRENRLCRGTLKVGQTAISPSGLSVPTLAVVNTADDVAPLASVRPFIAAMPTKDVRIIEHEGEPGVGLQHLAVLVGRRAHARIWPEINSWLNSH
jgi:polyhydroxyalkanoate synthase